ncbi:MAG: TonB-dependent siderophore receptor [Porticoccaceae bacterium]
MKTPAVGMTPQANPATFALRCLVLAVSCATLALPVAAQSVPDNSTRPAAFSVDIAPGPLGQVLSQFAAAAGVALAFDAGQLGGLQSTGLRGRYGVAEGFDRLLAGTGFAARHQGGGKYRLDAVAGGDARALPTVNVNAALLGMATEGSGSYTTGATNSATGLNLSLRETPQAVTVFTRSRIEDQNLDEISEVLDQTVGVSYNGTSALGSDGINYYARGFEVKNYQVDGGVRPTTIYGFEETTADMAIYDRVEVVRGATGLLSGTGSPSATVSLVRKRPTDSFAAALTGQAGSYDKYRIEADVSGPLTAQGNVRGRLVGAYQENDSHLDRMHIEKQVFYGVLDVDLPSGSLLTLGVDYQDFTNSAAPRGGVPLFFSDGTQTRFSRSTNVGANWSDFDQESLSLFAALEHRFANDWTVKLNLEHSRPEYDESIGYLYIWGGFDRQTGAGADVISSRWAGELEQNIVSVQASGPFSLFGREHELVVGASHSDGKDEGDDYPGWWSGGAYWQAIPDAYDFLATGNLAQPPLGATGGAFGGRAEQSGAFAALRLKPTDRVAVILGSRVTDWKETEWSQSASGAKTHTAISHETGVVTPYAGVVVDLSEQVSVYASYTQIFEPQSVEDVNGRTIDPLEGVNYEAGIKVELMGGLLNASAAIFRIEQDNFAVAIPNTFTPDGKAAYRAESGTVSEGFEVEVAGEVMPGLQVGGGFSRAEPEDADGDALLTYVPTDTFKLFSRYQFGGDLTNLQVGGNLRWQNEAYIEDAGPNGESFRQGSVALVDLMARYALTPAVSLGVNVNNLFDRTYYSGLSYAGVYGAPRNLSVTAKYSF